MWDSAHDFPSLGKLTAFDLLTGYRAMREVFLVPDSFFEELLLMTQSQNSSDVVVLFKCLKKLNCTLLI